MNLGTRSVPVNPCYFERAQNTGDAKRSVVHCNIRAGGIVKNNENTSAPAHTVSPSIYTTHGVYGVISIGAMHASQSERLRNKPEQPHEPTERGARRC